MGQQDPPLTKIRSHNAGITLFSMAIATNKNGARRRRFFIPATAEAQAKDLLFVFQIGVALQTQLQLVEQGFAGGLIQRRMGGDPLIALADH